MKNYSYSSKTINLDLRKKSTGDVKQIHQKIFELLGLLNKKQAGKFGKFKEKLSRVEINTTKSSGEIKNETWDIKLKDD
jgi:hypothetical protein